MKTCTAGALGANRSTHRKVWKPDLRTRRGRRAARPRPDSGVARLRSRRNTEVRDAMRMTAYLMACAMLAARPVSASIPMLPHDVINGCFQLKAASIELTAEGARGLRALIELISPRPERIMAAKVTVVRSWPLPGS